MKIFYIDPQSYNNLADYDKYLLENINYEKYFFCSTNLPYDYIKNTEIIKLYNYNNRKGVGKIIHYIINQFFLLHQIKIQKPEIIHFQWFKIPLFDFFLLIIIKLFNKKTKIIHTAHNVLPHDSGSKYINIYKKIYNFVDVIIVHAEITKNEIINLFKLKKNNIEVIPHGFLPIKINKKEDDGFNGITFSFIGFLSMYKGLDLLLDAWIDCDEILYNKNCRLIIAGAGTLDCLKKIPSKCNIILENFFHSEEELANIVKNSDVAILPYKKISQSGVLLTYLSEHIPVLVSNIGGLTQPFNIGPVGWILPDLSSDSIKNCLLKIIADKDNINLIKTNDVLWEKIDNFYSWKNIGKKTFSLYKRCVDYGI